MRVYIGDIHFKNLLTFESIQSDFFKWLGKNFGDKNYDLVFLGDIFDNRKNTNNEILNKAHRVFSYLSKKFPNIYIIVGNHDTITSFDGMNSNIMKTLFSDIPNVEVIEKITIKDDLILFPYDFKTTEEFENIKLLQNKSSYTLAGHFEIEGHYASEFSMPLSWFSQFRQVYAGHFHQPYFNGNFNYIGTPFELCHNPNGAEIERGVWVDDTFVLYPNYKHFYTYVIESKEDIDKLKDFYLEGKNVRVIAEANVSASNKTEIAKVLKTIERDNAVKVETYDKAIQDKIKKEDFNIFSDNDILHIINKFVDLKYSADDKEQFKEYIKGYF